MLNNNYKKHLNTALIRAADAFPGGRRNRRGLKDYLGVIKLLIQAGADVNYTDEYGRTPFIALIGDKLFTEEQKKDRAEIIQVFLKAKVNLNHVNRALIIAIKNHDFDAVQIILQIPKININHVDNDGNTPLIIAVQYVRTSYISGDVEGYDDCHNSQKIVEKLLATPGINPHHVNKNGDTAISLLEKATARYF